MMSKNYYAYILCWSKKMRIISLLGGRCCRCGETNPIVLEFHHKSGEKLHNIHSIKNKRFSFIEDESKKCALLCANCHSELHFDVNSKDKRRNLLKDKMLEYKNVFSCEVCGHKGSNNKSLTFHHRNKNDKLFSINIESWKVKKIKQGKVEDRVCNELDKCDVICSNCHRIKHTDVEKLKRFKKEILDRIKKYKEYQPIDKDSVLRLKAAGFKNIDIAKKLHCAKSSITYLLQKYGCK